jgi:predicted transcriptional regulator
MAPTWPRRFEGAAIRLAAPGQLYILVHMKQLLIEVDEETAAKLERVAPARSRKRSQFIRSALRRALWELEEQATADAYQRQPDSAADAYLDARAWEPPPRGRRRR